MGFLADAGGVVLQPAELLAEGGPFARRVLGEPEAEHQGGEVLSHLVVELAGDAPPLFLLHRHDPPEQLLAGRLLLLEGSEGTRQLGGPRADPQVELVPRPADLLLGPLPLGHVHRNTGNPGDLTGGVA